MRLVTIETREWRCRWTTFINTTYDISLDSQISLLPLGFSLHLLAISFFSGSDIGLEIAGVQKMAHEFLLVTATPWGKDSEWAVTELRNHVGIPRKRLLYHGFLIVVESKSAEQKTRIHQQLSTHQQLWIHDASAWFLCGSKIELVTAINSQRHRQGWNS